VNTRIPDGSIKVAWNSGIQKRLLAKVPSPSSKLLLADSFTEFASITAEMVKAFFTSARENTSYQAGPYGGSPMGRESFASKEKSPGTI
jgi:hypothetical protein